MKSYFIEKKKNRTEGRGKVVYMDGENGSFQIKNFVTI